MFILQGLLSHSCDPPPHNAEREPFKSTTNGFFWGVFSLSTKLAEKLHNYISCYFKYHVKLNNLERNNSLGVILSVFPFSVQAGFCNFDFLAGIMGRHLQ